MWPSVVSYDIFNKFGQEGVGITSGNLLENHEKEGNLHTISSLLFSPTVLFRVHLQVFTAFFSQSKHYLQDKEQSIVYNDQPYATSTPCNLSWSTTPSRWCTFCGSSSSNLFKEGGKGRRWQPSPFLPNSSSQWNEQLYQRNLFSGAFRVKDGWLGVGATRLRYLCCPWLCCFRIVHDRQCI
jgi:sarcosine oxidase delta subunit